MAKVIFLHWGSLRPSEIAFTKLIICSVCRSIGVVTISCMKEEHGASLVKLLKLGSCIGCVCKNLSVGLNVGGDATPCDSHGAAI